MSVALVERLVTITPNAPSPGAARAETAQAESARAEANRANGRLSHGPISREGKARSRQNGCKDGLTGAGIVLPPDAAAEVERRVAEYVATFRPRDVVEHELVRQMALGAWRSQELGRRIICHETRTNAARYVNWSQDQMLAAALLGQQLADHPEAVVAQLEQTSAGCDWLIGRWTLLGNGLKAAAEGGPHCLWTDADLTLVLNLLGRPLELRHLDDWRIQLESLRARAGSGSEEAVAELRTILEEQLADLQLRRDATWEMVEQRRLEDLRAGVPIDLGPDGTRLRRYEAAAERLFRSAWNKLERLRKDRGDPFIPHSERRTTPMPVTPAAQPTVAPVAVKPAAPPPLAASPVPAMVCPEPILPSSSPLLHERSTPVLDFWAAGPHRPGLISAPLSRYKTNPTPGQPAEGGRAPRHRELS